MPNFNDTIQELPQSFRREKKELDQAGINHWSAIRDLTDLELSQLARSGQASARNLKRLRGMAHLVCGLDLPPQDAALLMHAGIATPAALAACSPERLVRQTGRLERSLRTKRPAVVDLKVAGDWIRRAKQLAN
uniref:DUF4332 domain-containing protein n=1 Tax=Synechococcus sp. UW106 TaxID=368495 RepID=UPI000E0E39BC|nr:DUF4332 domain-containing protein [Synechococcus sp. UW106]